MKWLWDFGRTAFAALFTLGLALFSSDARAFVVDNTTATLVIAASFLSLSLLFWLYRHGVIFPKKEILPLNEEQIESVIDVVFADKSTSKDLDEIYGKFFPASGAMDASEYDKIQDRKKFIRAVVKSYTRRVSKKICGYYSVFPLSDVTFQNLKSGNLKESNITNDMVLDPNDPAVRVLYVCEICAVDSDAAYRLIYDLKRYVKKLLQVNQSIATVGAWGFSEPGRRLIKALGLREVGGFDRKRPFFEISVREAVRRLP